MPGALTNPAYITLCLVFGIIGYLLAFKGGQLFREGLFQFMTSFSLPWYAIATSCPPRPLSRSRVTDRPLRRPRPRRDRRAARHRVPLLRNEQQAELRPRPRAPA